MRGSHSLGTRTFVIGGLILFGVGLFFISNRQKLFNRNFEVYREFDRLNGLQKGAKVRVSGMEAGEVLEKRRFRTGRTAGFGSSCASSRIYMVLCERIPWQPSRRWVWPEAVLLTFKREHSALLKQLPEAPYPAGSRSILQI